jgi:protoheme ferro-lyase
MVMKRYQILILMVILVTISFFVGCGTSERDRAVVFYKEAYPIAKEIKQVVDDNNALLQEFSQRKVTNQEILRKTQEYTTRLEALPKALSMLYAPPPLRQVKDDIASAINMGIQGFGLLQQYVVTNDMSYANQADEKLMEANRLMMRVADEWDDGLAHYKIKPSEILP